MVIGDKKTLSKPTAQTPGPYSRPVPNFTVPISHLPSDDSRPPFHVSGLPFHD